MALVDSKGRLLGKVSLLDLGAALVILFVLIGIFVFPGASSSVAQIGVPTKPVEVEVVIRTASQNLGTLMKPGDKTNLIIRNEPYGEVTIKSIKELPENLAIAQPDGKVKSMPDPRPEAGLSSNLLVTLTGKAKITKDGPVLGNKKIKIGTPIEIEGFRYDFSNLNVRDLRILES